MQIKSSQKNSKSQNLGEKKSAKRKKKSCVKFSNFRASKNTLYVQGSSETHVETNMNRPVYSKSNASNRKNNLAGT